VTSIACQGAVDRVDKLNVTFTGDWSHEDQTALPSHPRHLHGTESVYVSTLYNLCISNTPQRCRPIFRARTSAADRRVVRVPNFGLGCTRPRAQVPGTVIGARRSSAPGSVGGPPGPFNYANVAAGLPLFRHEINPDLGQLRATDTGQH